MRYAWQTSRERDRFLAQFAWIAAVSFPAALGLSAAIQYFFSPIAADWSADSALKAMGLGIILWGYLAKTLYNRRREASIWAVEDRLILGIAEEELAAADREVSAGATDLGSLWSATQKRLDFYHKIATSQAERSFSHVQWAAIAGFTILAGSIVAAGLVHLAVVSIPLALVGISGSVLSGFLGSTFMRSQENAAAQLREYFNQPLEFSRLLAAERLIESLPEDQRGTAVNTLLNAISAGLARAPTDNLPSSGQARVERPRKRRRRR